MLPFTLSALNTGFLKFLKQRIIHCFSIGTAVALRAGRLIGDHHDPFDRILAAQALAEDIPIVSADPKLDSFGVRRIW